MDLIAISSFYFTTEEGGAQLAQKGNKFSIPTDTAVNREKVFYLMQCLRCFPANFPEIVEIEIKRSFSVSLSNVGHFHGKAGETRDFPRLAALYLITQRFGKPTSSSLWSPEIDSETPEESVKRLHAMGEAEAQAATEKSRSSNFVFAWRR